MCGKYSNPEMKALLGTNDRIYTCCANIANILNKILPTITN